jgi:hypothetical protein
MSLVKLTFLLGLVFSSEQLLAQLDNTYYFNGKQDSVLYREYANSFYAEKGFPVNFDGTFIIERTNKHKTYLIQMMDTVTRLEAEMILFDYLVNPETKEREKVIIDKFPVKLKGSPRKSVFIGDVSSGEKLNVNKLDFEVRLPDEGLESNISITQIDVLFDSTSITVKGAKLSDVVKKRIQDLPEGTLIKFDIHYLDLRGKPAMIKSEFFR